jgi:hypothetical protein
MSAIKTPIMYIQRGWSPGRIGRVRLSQTGRTLWYGELELTSLKGSGYKANYIDVPAKTARIRCTLASSRSTTTFVTSTGGRSDRCPATRA